MELQVTRDSVAAGDDLDAPHQKTFSFPDDMPIEEVISSITSSGYLAQIAGGKATWSVVSGFPIAVAAQQWSSPRAVSRQPATMSKLQIKNGKVCLHFTYHAQIEPEIVLAVLKKLQ